MVEKNSLDMKGYIKRDLKNYSLMSLVLRDDLFVLNHLKYACILPLLTHLIVFVYLTHINLFILGMINVYPCLPLVWCL